MNRIIRKLAMASGIALGLGAISVGIAADLTQEAKNEQVMNARRETRILTGFNTDPRLHAYDLIAIVDGDKASIGGSVDSDLARDLAGKIAQDADGIVHVDNHIHVDTSAAPRKRNSTDRSSKGG